ncbi:hypothetical protein [uncultured Clostridium sp.]|uniref:hypothetical protein n=1 Tax=uncultured Clostridium sp. TaxID=59620 RepID=UPI002608B0CD|nr:hypothetical protein [uncultured Clostridium sp.]
MIRTVVCHRDGCSGNNFFINSIDGKIQATCTECENESEYNLNDVGYYLVSTCKKCRNEAFKLFMDTDRKTCFAKCVECGEAPEKIFIDEYGNQVSAQEKLLNEVKEELHFINQRMHNLELKIDDMEKGQAILEESLAYINRYIIDEK